MRLPSDLDAWVEDQAGGKRGKPSYIRRLLERERDRAEEARMQEMFDRAWESLSEDERAHVKSEREAWLGAYPGRHDS